MRKSAACWNAYYKTTNPREAFLLKYALSFVKISIKYVNKWFGEMTVKSSDRFDKTSDKHGHYFLFTPSIRFIFHSSQL